jgi:hypothetical protein
MLFGGETISFAAQKCRGTGELLEAAKVMGPRQECVNATRLIRRVISRHAAVPSREIFDPKGPAQGVTGTLRAYQCNIVGFRLVLDPS